MMIVVSAASRKSGEVSCNEQLKRGEDTQLPTRTGSACGRVFPVSGRLQSTRSADGGSQDTLTAAFAKLPPLIDETYCQSKTYLNISYRNRNSLIGIPPHNFEDIYVYRKFVANLSKLTIQLNITTLQYGILYYFVFISSVAKWN